MAEVDDDTDTTDSNTDTKPATRGRDTDTHRGRLSYEELYARYKGAQEESKSHRLNSDRFAKMADETKTELAKAKAEAEKAVADAKAEYHAALKAAHSNHASALESLKGEHGTALEALKAELTGKVTEAETKAATALTAAQKRALHADLRVAATLAGMLDLDGLKLVDETKLELDDDGNLKNGEALMTALKEAKGFLFSKEPPPPPKPASSGNTETPPTPKTPTTKKATEMSNEEFAAAMAHISRYGKPPT